MTLTLNPQSFRLPNGDDLIVRLSTAADGTQSNSASYDSRTSADGRYMVFTSAASNLVAGDTNNTTDIFRKDLLTGVVVRVSTTSLGAETNNGSSNAEISADGRYVTFASAATNLVTGDTNLVTDLFRKDMQTGDVVRVSTALDGTQADSYTSASKLSADGHYLVFATQAATLVSGDTNLQTDIFRKDLTTGEVVRVSTASDGAQANNSSGEDTLSVSADGRYVLFESDATNLVAGDTNGGTDLFLKDILTGAVTRVSTARDGTQANDACTEAQLSADGHYIVFSSYATNLVDDGWAGYQSNIYRKDLVSGEVVRVSRGADG